MKQPSQVKNHDFTNIHWGQEFSIEFPFEHVTGSIVGQGSIKPDDYIVLCLQCRVDKVDYYADASDIWYARISVNKPISLETITPRKMLKFLRRFIAKPINFLNVFTSMY